MKKILITGFEPFGAETTNPSWDAVSMMADELEGAVLIKKEMPVVYDKVSDLLWKAIEEEKPDAVICVGQAGGRAGLTPEMVAVNIKDASIADNDGVLFTGEPIREDGPAAYFSTLPVKAMAAAMQQKGIPASVSYTAGTYVCNNIMYHLLDLLAQRAPQIKGCFIHVPFACGQVAAKGTVASLPLTCIRDGLEAAVAEAAKRLAANEEDSRQASGSTH